jgi:hypothetical protein
MTRRQARSSGLERERDRRQKVDRLKSQEVRVVAEAKAERASRREPERRPSVDLATQEPAPESTALPSLTGVRLPGQQVTCGWCGKPVLIKSRGPIPK